MFYHFFFIKKEGYGLLRYKFLEKNTMLYKYQFGFRKCHSTSHATITLMVKVYNALDTSKYVVGMFLDIKSALDTVFYFLKWTFMAAKAIPGIYNWFKSYLINIC